jgi:hypothetical protein
MSRANKFAKTLCGQLENRIDSHKWKPEWKFGTKSRESADVGGENKSGRGDKRLILVEAELRREDPVSNIVKVWKYLQRGRFPNGLVLFHGFSSIYRSSKHPTKRGRARDARLVGRLMENVNGKRVCYEPIAFKYLPYKGAKEGGGARDRAARRLANRIVARWRKVRIGK